MAFLENLGKKVGEAAQTAAKKSSELVEVTKLNMSIGSEEDKIRKRYMEMGKKVYGLFCADEAVGAEFTEDCEAVRQHEQAIRELKEKVMELKNIRICAGCGAEMEKNVVFCPKCGAKQQPAQPEATPETAPAKHCSACGAAVPADSAFCVSCGTKLA